MSALPSASGLTRAFACIASTALPQASTTTPRGERGTEVHAFLERLQNGMSRDESLDAARPEWRTACECIDVERLPAIDAKGYAAEVAFAYSLGGDSAREVGRSIGRNYGPLAEDEIPGTADTVALLADGESVYVGDYKAGYAKVPPAKDNAQLKFLALAACRAYGRSRAQVVIIRVRDDGSVWTDSAELDAFDLDLFAAELRDLRAKAVVVQAVVKVGAVPSVSMGDWCRYCPAFASCPGQTGLVRAATADPEALTAGVLKALTPENAAAAYIRLRQVEAAIGTAKEAVYRYAFAHPIPLPDGQVYGPVETHRDELDAETARRVLAERFGAAVAEKACEFSTSKKAIDSALREVQTARREAGEKVTLRTLNDEALDAIRAAGGLTTKTRQDVREHRPKAP